MRFSGIIHLAFSILLAFVNASSTWAAEDQKSRILIARGKTQIASLELGIPNPITINAIPFYIVLKGTFSGEGSLLLDKKMLSIKEPRNNFESKLLINRSPVRLAFSAVDSFGRVHDEEVEISIENWAQVQADLVARRKRWRITTGLGVSSNTYIAPEGTSYSQLASTFKISSAYALKPGTWELAANSFFTLLPFKEGSVNIRYFGINGRIGYAVPRLPSNWNLAIYGGWYYSTQFTNRNDVGYANISGPQLYPSLSRSFPEGKVLYGYFKFSPVASKLALLALSSREIAAGLGYGFPSRLLSAKPQRIAFTLDYADLALQTAAGKASNQSLTAGAEMTW